MLPVQLAALGATRRLPRDHQRGNIQAVHRPQHQSSYDSCKKQLIMRAMASQQAGSRGAHAPQQHQQPHHRVVARARGRIHAASADIHVHPSQGLDGSASSCPFLASLPQPPQAQIPWWDRLQQAFNPPSFQRRVLSGNSLVHLPPQMLFPEAYMVATGDLAKQIFSGETDGSTMVATQRLPRAVKLFGKNSMLWVPEPRHSFLRNLMQPAFTPEAIARYLPRVEAVVGRWLSSWADVGEAVPGHPGFSAMTFDFILQVVFGRDFTPEHVMRLSKVFKTFTMGFMAWPYQAIPFTRYGQAVQARQQLVDEFMVLVREERQHLEGGGEPHGLLGMMLLAQDEQGFKLTDEELQDNLILLLLAGHDTSSSTLALLMVNLQKHPEVVLKLRQEQQQILSKRGPAFTAGVLKDMTYADAVIRETLRKDNIVSASGRLTARDLDLGGYQVPAGTLVQIPLTYLSEQDPRWAGQQGDLDPAVFNPERMLSKEGAKPGWIMPFGHGPRYCLGAALAFVEMKVFLALLARSYEFHVEPDTDWTFAIGRVPNNGLPMTITRGVPSHALTQQMVAV